MFKNILIICTGNICRSPMAEALLTARLVNIAPQAVVTSAGLAAVVGYPADRLAQELMQEKGIDISKHRARQITPEILFDSELILTMETRQQLQIEYMLPNIRGRVHRLGKWGSFDVPDPYQKSKIFFAQSLELITQGIEDWQRKLWN